MSEADTSYTLSKAELDALFGLLHNSSVFAAMPLERRRAMAELIDQSVQKICAAIDVSQHAEAETLSMEDGGFYARLFVVYQALTKLASGKAGIPDQTPANVPALNLLQDTLLTFKQTLL